MTAANQDLRQGIKTAVESPEPWQRVVKVEISRETFDKAYAERLKKAVKTHQKPGFRKGKTPRALVEKELGSLLRAETMDDLVPQAWMAALLEHKLAALTDPKLENLKFDEGEPLTFDLVIEVRPDVTAADYEGIPVSKRAVEVTGKEVDEVVDRLRESRAEYVAVERPAAEGDEITLDLEPLDDAPDGESPVITDQKFILGAEHNLPAFNENLAGCEAGQEKDVVVDYPADFPNEKLRGRKVTFRCRVKQVAEKKGPEADDAFAASLEEGKTLADLKEGIRADLEKEAERRVAAEMDMQIRGELVARNDVSLPPSMVTRYLQAGLEDFRARYQRMGGQPTQKDEQEYMEASRPAAEKELKAMLLLEAVRRQEEIKITDEDVDERITEIAAENGFDVDRYREFVNSGDEKDRIRYDLAERRTLDFLLSRAEITEVAADADIAIP